MIRALAFAFACLLALPAAAQTNAQARRAVDAMSAMWRPVAAQEMTSPPALQTACAGALEEMAAIEAAMPPVISAESLSNVRALRGLLIVPGQAQGPPTAFFFPSAELPWFASGLGAVTVLSDADALIGVRDAAGGDISLQLGQAGGRPILRVRSPDGPILAFVGCASTRR